MSCGRPRCSYVFVFTAAAPAEFYTHSLHDALPICLGVDDRAGGVVGSLELADLHVLDLVEHVKRSEEHTSELQSHVNLVCRLLLEKKRNRKYSRSCIDGIISEALCLTPCVDPTRPP